MNIEQLKVFGERNTGTNWLEDLLMKNYDVPVVHHRLIIKKKTTEQEKNFIDSLHKEQQSFMKERVNDSIFEYQASQLFGWKHAAISSASLEQHPDFKKTGFIFLVKNPYAFIKSLHKRPYHALTKPPKSLDHFITMPWPTLRRDNIAVPLLQTPVELWNHKVSSYFDFMDQHSNAVFLRYESLLENYESLFDVIEDKFSVTPVSRLPIEKSTKHDRMNTADYQNKYLNAQPESGLSESSIRFMKSVLDDSLMQKCQYQHPM